MSFNLLPSETEIVGSWAFDGKSVTADQNERRIAWLLTNSLSKIAHDWSGWELLYQDSHDQRYWELTFPKGEMQGGGPRKLSLLSEIDAKSKYKL